MQSSHISGGALVLQGMLFGLEEEKCKQKAEALFRCFTKQIIAAIESA
jgi:hypothetical protein